jgi:DNA-binding Lrp family transcriptional regulator
MEKQKSFTQLDNELFASKHFNITEKVIISYITGFENNSKKGCFASYATIGKAMDVSRVTVINAITKLVNRGVINKKETFKKYANSEFMAEGHIFTINEVRLNEEINKVIKKESKKESLQIEENNITINQQTPETMIVKVNPLASQVAQDWAIELNNCEAEEDFVETIIEEQPTQATNFEDDGKIYDSVQKIYNLISQYGNYEFTKAEFIYETHNDYNIPFTKDNILIHGLQLV